MCYGYGTRQGIVTRRYWTREERIEWLKEYADALEKEAAAAKERIEELRQKKE